MEILFIAVGIIVGSVITFWILSNKSKGDSNAPEMQDLKQQIALQAQNVQSLEREKRDLVTELGTIRSRNTDLERDLSREQATLSTLRTNLAERISSLENENEDYKSRLDKARAEFITLSGKLGTAETQANSEREKYADLKRDTDAMFDNMKTGFENAAIRILEEKSEKFTTLNKTNLEGILTPLHERIESFQKNVNEVYRTESDERSTLKGEIRQLVERSKEISDVANNLARALETDTKQQGDWGELVLEKILEFSGLRKDSEYKLQESFTTEDGRLRPDAVVYLPENKHIIIDSKVSLTAYKRIMTSDSEDERKSSLKAHLASVRTHIKELASSNYHSISALNQPDFILLFMPIESSFGVAIQADNELFSYAWEQKIVIVSPSTLLATLRTISSIWKQEKQSKNAQEIAEKAGRMYDKFVGFVADLETVGKKINESKTTYDEAFKKLKDGRGSLIDQSQQMKELGAKAKKQIPLRLIEADELDL
jgi:DNA recombination protein RmuC